MTAREFVEKELKKRAIMQNVLVIGCILFFAWLFNKPLEATFFCIAHLQIRKVFDRQYHNNIDAICMAVTISVAFFGIYFMLPSSVSLLSSVPIAYFVCWVGFLCRSIIDKEIIIKRQEKIIKEQEKIIEELSKKPNKERIVNELMIKRRTVQKYRPYLKAVILEGMKDCDYFKTMPNDSSFDEQQYRNEKSKFLKELKQLL